MPQSVRFRAWLGSAALLGAGVLTACSSSPPAAAPPSPRATQTSEGGDVMALQVKSSAFSNNEPIPRKYTEDGQDLSPPLSWSGAPEQTKQFALIVDDPDAPREEPWVHWVLYKIPPGTTSLPEGLPRTKTLDMPAGAVQGVNSFRGDNIGYRGPAPPPGHGTHHYHFKVYALDTIIDAGPGLTKDALLKQMEGHVLATGELVGTYER